MRISTLLLYYMYCFFSGACVGFITQSPWAILAICCFNMLIGVALVCTEDHDV